MTELFFEDWSSLLHIALSTVIAFVTLFLFIRISGKRTLSKLNAFDFVVTVALGSTLTYMMLGLVPLAEGAEVLLLIILLQHVFAWSTRTSKHLEKLINSVPRLLYYEGIFINEAMKKESVTEEEMHAAIRTAGIEYIEEVKAIVMEINGEITVIQKSNGSGDSALEGISKPKL